MPNYINLDDVEDSLFGAKGSLIREAYEKEKAESLQLENQLQQLKKDSLGFYELSITDIG